MLSAKGLDNERVNKMLSSMDGVWDSAEDSDKSSAQPASKAETPFKAAQWINDYVQKPEAGDALFFRDVFANGRIDISRLEQLHQQLADMRQRDAFGAFQSAEWIKADKLRTRILEIRSAVADNELPPSPPPPGTNEYARYQDGLGRTFVRIAQLINRRADKAAQSQWQHQLEEYAERAKQAAKDIPATSVAPGQASAVELFDGKQGIWQPAADGAKQFHPLKGSDPVLQLKNGVLILPVSALSYEIRGSDGKKIGISVNPDGLYTAGTVEARMAAARELAGEILERWEGPLFAILGEAYKKKAREPLADWLSQMRWTPGESRSILLDNSGKIRLVYSDSHGKEMHETA